MVSCMVFRTVANGQCKFSPCTCGADDSDAEDDDSDAEDGSVS